MLAKKYFKLLILTFFILGLFNGQAVFAATKISAKTTKTATKTTAVAAKKKTVVKKVVVKKPNYQVSASRMLGRLILEVDSDNKLWYIEPQQRLRYLITSDDGLNKIIDQLAVKPTVKEFKQLAQNKTKKTPAALVKKYQGRIVLDPSDSSQAYYFNPGDNLIYSIDNYGDLYSVAKTIGLSANDVSLRAIKMNDGQFTYDPAWYGTASVRYDGTSYFDGVSSDQILPLASLSKVMTALVFLDTNPDWNKIVTITPAEIKYPCTLQACGSTSEVDLQAGDQIKISDLWIAMLNASSNQSAVILADNSGLSRADFIQKMNDKALSLGLTKTRFVEMSGLSANNISTAKEFAKIAQTAFSNDTVAAATRYTTYDFFAVQADGQLRNVEVKNRNYSLLAFGPDASKTGFLTEAQRNAAVLKDNQVVVVLHAYSLPQRNQIVKNLLDDSQLASAQ